MIRVFDIQAGEKISELVDPYIDYWCDIRDVYETSVFCWRQKDSEDTQYTICSFDALTGDTTEYATTTKLCDIKVAPNGEQLAVIDREGGGEIRFYQTMVSETIEPPSSSEPPPPPSSAVTQEPPVAPSFSYEKIEAGKVVCIGQIELTSTSAYSLTVTVDEGSGLFVGLYRSGDITNSSGTAFDQRFGTPDHSISAYFDGSNQAGTYYVYVGSAHEGTELININGTLSHENS
jgi:hypothetical protein